MSNGENNDSEPWAHWDALSSLLVELDCDVRFSGPVSYRDPERDQDYQIAATALVFFSLASNGKEGLFIASSYLRLAKYLIMRPSLLPTFTDYVLYFREKEKESRPLHLPRGYSADPNHSKTMRFLLIAKTFRATDKRVYEGINIGWLYEVYLGISKDIFGGQRQVISTLQELKGAARVK